MPRRPRPGLSRLPAELRPLVIAAQRSRLSRRSLLRGAAAGGTGAGLAAALAACGTGGSTSGGDASGSAAGSTLAAAEDRSEAEPVVNWANWPAYIDQNDDGSQYPTLEAFTEETGIDVEYVEDIDDNDSYYGRVSGQLANGQDIGQDIITPTDWLVARLIRLGYVQELDDANIPNKANLLPALADVDYDPGRTRSLTWQSGFGGFAWNTAEVPNGIRTLDDLFAPELSGRVSVLSEMRDTVGIIMREQGVDISGDWGADEFGAALELLEEQIGSGQIRQVTGNSYLEDLSAGNIVAVIGWSGDIAQLALETDGGFAFGVPEAGGTLFSDNMVVPIGSPRKTNAERVMDYYYDPEVAAQVAAYVQYISPVQGAREAMESVDPTLVDNPFIFPSEADLANVSVFRGLSAEEETQFSEDFQRVIGY